MNCCVPGTDVLIGWRQSNEGGCLWERICGDAPASTEGSTHNEAANSIQTNLNPLDSFYSHWNQVSHNFRAAFFLQLEMIRIGFFFFVWEYSISYRRDIEKKIVSKPLKCFSSIILPYFFDFSAEMFIFSFSHKLGMLGLVDGRNRETRRIYAKTHDFFSWYELFPRLSAISFFNLIFVCRCAGDADKYCKEFGIICNKFVGSEKWSAYAWIQLS